jgi:hypothetical protein
MDAALGWTVAGSLAGSVAVLLAGTQLRIAWLDRRDHRRQRLMDASVGQVSGSGTTPPWGRLPRTGIQGRGPLLQVLRRALRRRRNEIHVLTGMGGVGKSAVALALCERARRRRWLRRRRHMWWISGTDQATITAGMIGVARRVNGSPEDLRLIAEGAAEAPERLWALLERSPAGWLLVVDNADNPQYLAAPPPAGSNIESGSVADGTGWVRPSRRGLVVVTSRARDPHVWGMGHVYIHHLQVLNEDDATQVLVALVQENRKYRSVTTDDATAEVEQAAARALAVRLGRLPLALHMAGSVVGSPYSSWASLAAYLHAFNATGVMLLTPPPDAPQSEDPRALVMRTWELSLDALDTHNLSLARPLLRLLSCYAPAVRIPDSLVNTSIIAQSFGTSNLNAEPLQDNHIEQARNGLARVGLIDLVTSGRPDALKPDIVVHRLIAETNRLHLDGAATSDSEARAIRATAAQLIAAAVAGLDSRDAADWPSWRMLAPHVHALLASIGSHLPPAELASLVSAGARTVDFLIRTGASSAGRLLGQAALTHTDKLGSEEPAALSVLFQLLLMKRKEGRWEEAEAGLRQVLDSQVRVLGREHRDSLRTRYELARVAGQLGHWVRAATEYRHVLDVQVRVLGLEHPETLLTRHGLAWTTGALDRWEDASTELRRVLEARVRILGPEHPDTLHSRHSVARAAGELGQWEDAATQLRHLLEARTRVLGPEHPDTLDVRHSLAWAIGELGQWEDAAAELHQVLNVQARVLDADNPTVLATRGSLARACQKLGQWENSATQLRHLLEARTRVLGPEHPDTLDVRHSLAWAIGELGQWEEAAAELHQVLNVQIQTLGPRHPTTLATRQSLVRAAERLSYDAGPGGRQPQTGR